MTLHSITTHTAGDTLTFLTELPDYPASSGWSVEHKLLPRTGSATAITLTSAASNDAHRTTASAADTASWTAGTYGWVAYAKKTGERHTIAQGEIVIKPDPAGGATNLDNRTHAARTLEAIESVIEGRATSSTAEYEIAGRKLKHIPIPELLTLRDRYKAEATCEQSARDVAQGLPDRRRVLVRFF